jgi:hypothetical protein
VRLKKKNLQKNTLAFNGGMKLRKPSILVLNWVSSCLSFINFGAKLSFILSFLFPECLHCYYSTAYIFTTPNCTTTIFSLGPRALNAEFQHFILRFNKNGSFTLVIATERGDRGWKEAQRQGWRQGYFTDNSNIRPEFIFHIFQQGACILHSSL